MNNKELVDTINHNFQMLLKGKKYPDHHIFFESLEWWNNAYKEWSKDSKDWEKNDKKNIFSYKKLNLDLNIVKDCKYKTNKIISHEKLVKLHQKINDPKITDFNKIDDELKMLYKYNLPSTIKSLDEGFEKDSINIIIIGAGPIGLFTALYYKLYYRDNFLQKKINVILIDNRVFKEGIRMPYTRSTQFGFDAIEFQDFINQMFCWSNFYISRSKSFHGSKNRAFNYINTLENLLYIEAYNKSVKMYFTNQFSSYEDLEKYAIKKNFNYIIDCTGGRLRKSINNKLNWNIFKFKKNNMEVKLDNDKYKLFKNNNEIYDRVIAIYLFDKNMNPIRVGNIFGFLEDKKDIPLIEKFNGKCFKKDDYIKIARSFYSRSIRYLLNGIKLELQLSLDKVKYIKFTSFKTLSDHSQFAAKQINSKLTYIGLGETLGHTQFGIYFGMASSVRLSKHVCHLIGSVK